MPSISDIANMMEEDESETRIEETPEDTGSDGKSKELKTTVHCIQGGVQAKVHNYGSKCKDFYYNLEVPKVREIIEGKSNSEAVEAIVEELQQTYPNAKASLDAKGREHAIRKQMPQVIKECRECLKDEV